MGLFKLNGIIGKPPPSTVSLVFKQLNGVTLKAVKAIVATYDPFDQNSIATRKFLTYLHSNRVQDTSPEFSNIRTIIKCDRSEPTVAFKLRKDIIFKGANLTELDMVELYVKHVSPAAPTEERTDETFATKAMRKSKK